MQRFYSRSTGSTYFRESHLHIPSDVVPISEKRYEEVIANPAHGKIISHDAAGLPILIDQPPYVPTADDHRAAVAAERHKRETAGIEIEGMAIDTGRDSQALITGAAVSAMLDSSYSVQWKTLAGFVSLTAEQIIGVASAVRAHVQACFDREAELLAALQDGSYTPEMLDEGWPPQDRAL